MPGRKLPEEIMGYLGPCRESETVPEKVVEQCGLAKLMGDSGLSDYDPLVVVMHLVTEEILGLGLSLKDDDARNAWCEVLQEIQEDNLILEHNKLIPCRRCDVAFEPLINDSFLAFYLVWYESNKLQDLLAIHRCPACGGQLAAKRTERYDGDMHTPEPGFVDNDEEWADHLLQVSGLYCE